MKKEMFCKSAPEQKATVCRSTVVNQHSSSTKPCISRDVWSITAGFGMFRGLWCPPPLENLTAALTLQGTNKFWSSPPALVHLPALAVLKIEPTV